MGIYIVIHYIDVREVNIRNLIIIAEITIKVYKIIIRENEYWITRKWKHKFTEYNRKLQKIIHDITQLVIVIRAVENDSWRHFFKCICQLHTCASTLSFNLKIKVEFNIKSCQKKLAPKRHIQFHRSRHTFMGKVLQFLCFTCC